MRIPLPARLGLTLCLAVCAFAAPPANWTPAFSESFDRPDWAERWEIRGAMDPAARGQLALTGAQEAYAIIRRKFDAPAVRVEYDAQMLGNTICDLSCLIGEGFGPRQLYCGFMFAGEQNTLSRLVVPDKTDTIEPKAIAKPGQTYRVRAELNGRLAVLSVDGKVVLRQTLYKELPRPWQVALYSFQGGAAFHNVRVSTKSQADPLPADLAETAPTSTDTPQITKWIRDVLLPPIDPVRPAAVERAQIPIRIDPGAWRHGTWPVTMGVPIPRETLWDAESVRLLTPAGKDVPLQARPTATWTRGGAIQWLLLDFNAEAGAAAAGPYVLEYGRTVRRTPADKPVTVQETADQIMVDTGALKLAVSKQRGSVIDAAWLDINGDGRYDDEEAVVQPGGGQGAYFVTQTGERFESSGPNADYSAVVESAGLQRVVIRTRGWYQNGKGGRACYFIHRLYLYRDQPFVRLFTTWVITMDTDKMWFKDLGLRLPLKVGAEAGALLGPDTRFQSPPIAIKPLDAPAQIAQVNRNQGIILSGSKTIRNDLWRIGGWADLSDETRGATLAVFDMEQQSPTALEVRKDALVYHIFSSLADGELKFDLDYLRATRWGPEVSTLFETNQGPNPPLDKRTWNGCGMAKTTELLIRFHGKDAGDAAAQFARTVQQPPLASADGTYVCGTGAVGPVHPVDTARFPAVESALSRAFDVFLIAQDGLWPRYDFYDYGMGMPHFVAVPPRRRAYPAGMVNEFLYTGYRREYDRGYGNTIVPWLLYLRSGERKYHRFGTQFDRHVMDPQAHHWTNGPLRKQTGWVVADFGNWVNDSLNAGFSFNNWMESLLLDYYVTGYERARDVAIETMDAFADTLKDGEAVRGHYCGFVGLWTGNAALMTRSTWDPRYEKVYRNLERETLRAWCRECGGFARYSADPPACPHPPDEHNYTERNGWREYGVYHASRLPGHSPDIDTALARMGESELRAHAQRPPNPYETGGYVYWAAHEKTRDAKFLQFAQARLAEAGAGLNFSFNLDTGLAAARASLVWMTMLAQAGLPPAAEPKAAPPPAHPPMTIGPLPTPPGLFGRFDALDFNDAAWATASGPVTLPGTGNFRLEMWIFVPGGRKNETRFFMDGQAQPGKMSYGGVEVAANGICAAYYGDAVTPSVSVFGTTDVRNRWTHVAADFDRAGRLTLYVNGRVEGTPLPITPNDLALKYLRVCNSGALQAGGVVAQLGLYRTLRDGPFAPPETLPEADALALFRLERPLRQPGSAMYSLDLVGKLSLNIAMPDGPAACVRGQVDIPFWIAGNDGR